MTRLTDICSLHGTNMSSTSRYEYCPIHAHLHPATLLKGPSTTSPRHQLGKKHRNLLIYPQRRTFSVWRQASPKCSSRRRQMWMDFGIAKIILQIKDVCRSLFITLVPD